MKIVYSKRFLQSFKKQTAFIKEVFTEQFYLFRNDPKDSSLADHALRGRLQGFRAFSVSDDIRVVYFLHNKDTIELDNIGPHSTVYKQ